MTAQQWEVLTLVGHYWDNVWSVDDEPELFESAAEADAALTEHLRECQLAVDEGDMIDAPTRDAFRIAPYVKAEEEA
jgi:hypothetical protein